MEENNISTESLKSIVRVLFVVCAALLAVIIYRYYSQEDRQTSLNIKDKKLFNLSIEELGGDPGRDFSAYDEVFKKRDIFDSPYGRRLYRAAEEPAPEPTPEAEVDLSKQYKLVGILLGYEPEVIITEIETNETSSLSIGDKLGEAAFLTDVEEGKAIFNVEGKTAELSINEVKETKKAK